MNEHEQIKSLVYFLFIHLYSLIVRVLTLGFIFLMHWAK